MFSYLTRVKTIDSYDVQTLAESTAQQLLMVMGTIPGALGQCRNALSRPSSRLTVEERAAVIEVEMVLEQWHENLFRENFGGSF